MPCQNEPDENWGDDDGENCFCFLRRLFTKIYIIKLVNRMLGFLDLDFFRLMCVKNHMQI